MAKTTVNEHVPTGIKRSTRTNGNSPAKNAPGRKVALTNPLPQQAPSVSFQIGVGLIVQNAVIDETSVEAEARRWTRGVRGEPVAVSEMNGADLTEFHRMAICLGALALQATGDNATAVSLSGTVSLIANRAQAAADSLINDAQRATTKAAQDITEATTKLVDEVSERFDKKLGDGINEALGRLTSDVMRLVGPEGGALVVAVHDIVTKLMGDTQATFHKSLTTTLTEVVRNFDVKNPSSPLGSLERRLLEEQARNRTDLIREIDKLSEIVQGMANAARTTAAVTNAHLKSPAKGRSYEEAVGTTLESIAAGMGAAYIDTSNTIGAVKSCKKGDGVLEKTLIHRPEVSARVVVEVTTEYQHRNWPQYLEQAQKNRAGKAALGLVPRPELVPGGDLLRLIRPHQIVLAFDPEHDNPSLLRVTVQLLVLMAEYQLSENGSGDHKAVGVCLDEARQCLVHLADTIKTAVSLKNGATKVVTSLEAIYESLTLCLEKARSALALEK